MIDQKNSESFEVLYWRKS